MKFLFGLDVTQGEENAIYDGEEFVVQKASDAQTDALAKATEESLDIMLKYKTPFFIKFFGFLSGISLVLSSVAMVALCENNGVEKVYEKMPWLFYLLGFSMVLLVVSVTAAVKRYKRTVESEVNTYKLSKLDTISANIYTELGVPADAIETEILSPRYAYGYNDEIVLKKQMHDGIVVGTEYEDYVYKLFVRENTPFVVDTEAKYAIPISEMRGIKTVNEKIAISGWTNDVPYNKGRFKEYKIWETDSCDIAFKPYHILVIEHNGQEWGMYFPCYELPTIEKLTGLKAQ